jgi:GTPase
LGTSDSTKFDFFFHLPFGYNIETIWLLETWRIGIICDRTVYQKTTGQQAASNLHSSNAGPILSSCVRVQVKRDQVRKGMVLVHKSVQPVASWEFDAEIAILTHSTTIQPRYQAVIHCEIIRQAARVVAMDRERLRSGDRATVRFRFLQHPEYLTVGTRFVFREGRTKGIGMVASTGVDCVA